MWPSYLSGCGNPSIWPKLMEELIIELHRGFLLFPLLRRLSISGVDFINILRTSFSYESKLRSFSKITIWRCDFLAKGYRKMLIKLTLGINQMKKEIFSEIEKLLSAYIFRSLRPILLYL